MCVYIYVSVGLDSKQVGFTDMFRVCLYALRKHNKLERPCYVIARLPRFRHNAQSYT